MGRVIPRGQITALRFSCGDGNGQDLQAALCAVEDDTLPAVNDSNIPASGLTLSPQSTASAIEELGRRGKKTWGASYYSQLAPVELCDLAGRSRPVQYGALISWLKRIADGSRPAPMGAIALVAHLTDRATTDSALTTKLSAKEAQPRQRRNSKQLTARDTSFEVNCPSVIHDYRFVVVGELPRDHLYAAVFVQPVDGTGYWYPQLARNNPLRAGRAFACFVQIGNPAGIWHIKRPPLDAKVRVLVLDKPWSPDFSVRMQEEELVRHAEHLGLVDQKDCLTSRVWTDPLAPSLRDCAEFSKEPLIHYEPQARSCVAPLTLDWKGGAAYIEIREGDGDALIFQGTAAPGAVVTMRGGHQSIDSKSVLFELAGPNRYRVRLYPAVKSFVDPPFEWWLEVR